MFVWELHVGSDVDAGLTSELTLNYRHLCRHSLVTDYFVMYGRQATYDVFFCYPSRMGGSKEQYSRLQCQLLVSETGGQLVVFNPILPQCVIKPRRPHHSPFYGLSLIICLETECTRNQHDNVSRLVLMTRKGQLQKVGITYFSALVVFSSNLSIIVGTQYAFPAFTPRATNNFKHQHTRSLGRNERPGDTISQDKRCSSGRLRAKSHFRFCVFRMSCREYSTAPRPQVRHRHVCPVFCTWLYMVEHLQSPHPIKCRCLDVLRS